MFGGIKSHDKMPNNELYFIRPSYEKNSKHIMMKTGEWKKTSKPKLTIEV